MTVKRMNAEGPRWFLSYHSPDHALAERLKTAIERNDSSSRVFFAPAHLRAGGSWTAQLAQEIAHADAFILLVGERGNRRRRRRRRSRCPGGRGCARPAEMARSFPPLKRWSKKPYFMRLSLPFGRSKLPFGAGPALEPFADIANRTASRWRRADLRAISGWPHRIRIGARVHM
jgi:hypothetical protein